MRAHDLSFVVALGLALTAAGCSSECRCLPPGWGDAGPIDAPPVPDVPVDAPVRAFPSLLPEHDGRALFVGNSYTFYNDLPGLYRTTALAAGEDLDAEAMVAAGGWTLAQHATDAATDGTDLSMRLRTGTGADTDWDVVVLQDQSQIPGFPATSPDRIASEDGASALGALADARGAAIVLYATWGRERGDETNPTLFPDFVTMEAALESGYRAMEARLVAEGRRVRLAPVGATFARIHADLVEAGEEPTAEGSLFDALYDADGSHPSPLGTYLVACVMVGTITGRDPMLFATPAGLPEPQAYAVRVAAATTLTSEAWRPTP